MTLPEDVPLVVNPDREYPNARQLEDYRQHRENVLEWLYAQGKHPDRQEGYSHSVTRNMAYRASKIYRWLWERKGGYTTNLSHDHADVYVRELAGKNWKNSNKAQYVKALKRLFKWRRYERNGDHWEPEITFHPSSEEYQPQDFFTLEERKRFREASLEYGSVPTYGNLGPDERSRWKAYLAQRFEKPKDEVTPADWKRANLGKYRVS